MGRFADTDEIFETEKPFRESYKPEEFSHREEQIKEIASPLKSVVTDGISPKNIFIYGSHGTGKTTAVHNLLSELKEDADNVDVTIVSVQCRNTDSSYKIAIEVVNELRDRRGAEEQMSPTGHPTNVVIDALFEELDKTGGVVLLVLDEFDHFDQDDDNLLYMLSRAKAEGHVEESDPAIIGISNDHSALDNLKPETKDSLGEVEVTFPPYNTDELIEILRERVEKGFKTGVVEEAAIRKCAAIAAGADGSARKAISLIYESGIVARDFDDSEKVTLDHLEEAKHRAEQKRLQDAIQGMGPHTELTLCSAIHLSLNGTNLRKKTIYEKYKGLADGAVGEILSERRVNERLSNLTRQGLLETETQNNSGVFNKYELQYPEESYVKALEEVDDPAIGISIIKLQKKVGRSPQHPHSDT